MEQLASALDATFRDEPLWYFKRVITVHPRRAAARWDGTPDEGVVDANGQVFGHPGLSVADGSVMPGPVGPNPSLTIAALADRFAEWMLAELVTGGPLGRRPLGEHEADERVLPRDPRARVGQDLVLPLAEDIVAGAVAADEDRPGELVQVVVTGDLEVAARPVRLVADGDVPGADAPVQDDLAVERDRVAALRLK